ncbi:conserved membrane protein of unknown function [Acetoanaerobium sticklandii]|uniref:Permease n=1 Tax=Acetoanaerobium sticklandii (strain ATCC 12662 / DSM 519 / JCM 1433 / CCUG 9281 / NCIMB 10654 / HF) TaxID=499177 RepID=E3PR52_ACESD|nr:DUF979 domain-containing protein [Acetoanaerobium sticklandii]CBH20249.1 conserved membrane protein of unknown function [Acetoanaerobium sticklandii]
MVDILLEIFYILSGLVAFSAAYMAFKDANHPKKIGTAMFWILLGLTFMIGKYIPAEIVGIMILAMGGLTAFKQVAIGNQENAPDEFRQRESERIGNKIFLPALSMAVFAFLIAQFTTLGGLVGLGIGTVISIIMTLAMTKANPSYISYDGSRLLQQIGSSSILPQLLAALGALFAVAGVGEVISTGISSVIPQGNILLGVIAYCLGMAIFTMIMGNAFAAFAVITAGIGIPFVYSQGANPAIVGTLALTAGYCGTLMTPMAANFNVVPAAILETKNEKRVIISQIPFAIAMLLTHIALMYFWAF